jgi:hypothetical protein
MTDPTIPPQSEPVEPTPVEPTVVQPTPGEPTPQAAAPAYTAPPAPQAYPTAPSSYPAYGQVSTAPRTNVLAIVAFILAFFISIAGVIVGFIALSQIKRTGEGGRGLALAAVILGFVFLALGIIFVIFWVVLFAEYGNYYNYG